MSSDNQNNCLNCGEALRSSYCPMCGQRKTTKGVRFKDIGEQVSATVFNLESPFYTTFKTLLLNPGRMVREFINGRRESYFKPVPYHILLLQFICC